MAQYTNARPLVVEIDEAKKELVQAVNNVIQTHAIPFYILDMIVSEIGTQIKEAANAELAQAREQTAEQQHTEEE